jgi:hypothetical protein
MKTVCTSRPDCPCEFCANLRVKHEGGKSEKDEENRLAEEFMQLWNSIPDKKV